MYLRYLWRGERPIKRGEWSLVGLRGIFRGVRRLFRGNLLGRERGHFVWI